MGITHQVATTMPKPEVFYWAAIGRSHRGGPPGVEIEHPRDMSKPAIGPGERRLQRR